MKADDVSFFFKYHTTKATQVRQDVVSALKRAQPISRAELFKALPEGSRVYLETDQPRVLDIVLENLKRDGIVSETLSNGTPAYTLR